MTNFSDPFNIINRVLTDKVARRGTPPRVYPFARLFCCIGKEFSVQKKCVSDNEKAKEDVYD